MAGRLIVGIVAVAAGVWLATGLHSARLVDEGQSIARRPSASLSSAEVAKAMSLFERSRANNPDTRPIVFEAGLLARRGRRSEAVALLQDVVRREPQNANAWALLAIAARPGSALAAGAAARARTLNPPVAPAQ
jgi:Flp pilus assembly protein TadD